MEFKIQSGKYISLEIIKIAMDILRESHCPYESFKNSLLDYDFLSAKMKNLAKLKLVKVEQKS